MHGIKGSPWIDPVKNERGAHHPNGRLTHYSKLMTQNYGLALV
jgi:hypothetical protein